MLLSILDRLQKEFEGELILIDVLEGSSAGTYVKPVEDPYVKYLYARREPDIENVRGDVFRRGSNYRTGFASRGTFLDTFAFYLHPEYIDSSEEDGDVDLIEGYGKAMAGPIEIRIGKGLALVGSRPPRLDPDEQQRCPSHDDQGHQPAADTAALDTQGARPVPVQWFLTELGEHRVSPRPGSPACDGVSRPHPSWSSACPGSSCSAAEACREWTCLTTPRCSWQGPEQEVEQPDRRVRHVDSHSAGRQPAAAVVQVLQRRRRGG